MLGFSFWLLFCLSRKWQHKLPTLMQSQLFSRRFDGDVPYFIIKTYCFSGSEGVFTVLFEYCRVSDTALECILERFVSNKLPSEPEDIRIRVVISLVQVWKHFLSSCASVVRVWVAGWLGSYWGGWLDTVFRGVDNTIHWKNLHPVDSPVRFVNTYTLDSDLSVG